MPRNCPDCGAARSMKRVDHETFTIRHGGVLASVVGLSGWRCGACDNIIFDAESAQLYAAAGDELVADKRR
jgi:HTH-type transcriptional regulator/antitoxin MqsA